MAYDNDALMAAAAQMLSMSGPSRTPVGLGQILGGGIGAYKSAELAAKQRKLEEDQARQMAEMRAIQMQKLQGEVLDDERARNTPKAPEFSTAVQVGRDLDGKTFSYVLAKDGSMKRLDGVLPRDEMKLEGLGGKKVAINPYELQSGQEFAMTQTPDSIASNQIQLRGQDITMRGQNMTDSRARDLNAISQGANGLKLMEKAETAKMTKASQVASFDTMLGTLERLSVHPGLPNSVGLRGALPTMPGSESANFQAELDTFQSQAFIPMVAQLKGMGALSDAEGKKLTAAVGALNPKMGEKAFKESLGRVMRDMESARARVAGTPQASVSAAPKSSIPQGAANMLKMNPKLRAAFDEKYGAGAAASVLGE